MRIMELLLKNADVFCGGKIEKNKDVYIEGGYIRRIAEGGSLCYTEAEVIDGGLAVSGYIDLHTHGGGGYDCMDATEEALCGMARYHLLNGTTTFLPTTVTASFDELMDVILAVAKLKQPYARAEGVHLEGPFLSPKAAGAQAVEELTVPTNYFTALIERYADVIKRITVAPDVEGVSRLTADLTAVGIQVSAGHDGAVYQEITECMRNGLNSVTHLFNATSRAARRGGVKKLAGLTETALLKDELYAELICDGVHVPYEMIELAFKCKGADKILLVSDSLSVSGVKDDGELYLGSKKAARRVHFCDGVCCLEDGTVAGSVTPVSMMVQRLIANTDIALEDILRSTTLTPAKLMGFKDRGDIAEGMLADLNVLDYQGNIRQTVFNGRLI